LADELAASLAEADAVVVTDVYGAGDPPIPGITGELVADALRSHRPAVPVLYVGDRAELGTRLRQVLRRGDLCLTLGAGDLTTLPDELLEGRE
jgi:UDP-N-acetylmuramate--alanine ligase